MYQMTEFVSRVFFLEFILFHTSLYVSKGVESFLVTPGHFVETNLVQFVVYWSMYISLARESGQVIMLCCSLFDPMRTLVS